MTWFLKFLKRQELRSDIERC